MCAFGTLLIEEGKVMWQMYMDHMLPSMVSGKKYGIRHIKETGKNR